MLFHRLSLEAFCHATEDLERVKTAMLNLLPAEAAKTAKFKEQKQEGSFGNEITIVSLEFDKQSDVKGIVDLIKGSLPKEELADFDIDEHVTDHSEFWMRFDKQKACLGEMALGGNDTIQLKGKVAAFPAKREKAIELMEGVWS